MNYYLSYVNKFGELALHEERTSYQIALIYKDIQKGPRLQSHTVYDYNGLLIYS